MIAAVDIYGLIGLGIRAWREENKLRQEDAAQVFNANGLTTWTRGTVAQLEAGTRRPPLGDLLLICLAVDRSLAELVPADAPEMIDFGADVHMKASAVKALLSGARPGDLPDDDITTPLPHEMADAVELYSRWLDEARRRMEDDMATQAEVRLLLGPAGTDTVFWQTFRRPVEAEERAAERLGVPAPYVKAAAHALWSHDFEAERDARAGNDTAAGRLQARRGHATRAMLTELREYMDAVGIARADVDGAGGSPDA
jgi:transcriptional regulator with XRE-family HTH domain